MVHQVKDFWRSQRYTALHYQQEQFETVVQEHQRAAYDQVEKLQLLLPRVVQQRK